MTKSSIFWQTYLNLEKEAIEVSKYIFITDVKTENQEGKEVEVPCYSQLETFSPYIADLLVRCCVQIEAISKELYYDNGGEKPRGDNSIYFDKDCLKLIDQKWKTHNKQVLVVAPFFNLIKEENNVLRPLKEAHKRQGTYWERAYQAVKHDRYSSLSKGNVKAFLQALAALYLLNIYYRNDFWTTKYNDIRKADYSMGSALFSVNPPVTDQLWYENKPIISKSPFVVKYVDNDYKKIKDIQNKEYKALKDYWESQPELKEPQFKKILIDEQNKNPEGKVMVIGELAKYRLHKLIPQSLSFEEKKNRLINSEAWNCRTNQQAKQITPEDLTDGNIEKEIDSVGTLWGIDILNRYQPYKWIGFAMNGAICKIYIPKENAISPNNNDIS